MRLKPGQIARFATPDDATTGENTRVVLREQHHAVHVLALRGALRQIPHLDPNRLFLRVCQRLGRPLLGSSLLRLAPPSHGEHEQTVEVIGEERHRARRGWRDMSRCLRPSARAAVFCRCFGPARTRDRELAESWFFVPSARIVLTRVDHEEGVPKVERVRAHHGQVVLAQHVEEVPRPR